MAGLGLFGEDLSEEGIELGRVGLNTLGNVGIIGEDKGITKSLGMVFENFVVYGIAKAHEIFFDEHGGGASIALVKGVDLPDMRGEIGDVFDLFGLSEGKIIDFLLF